MFSRAAFVFVEILAIEKAEDSQTCWSWGRDWIPYWEISLYHEQILALV